MSKAVAVRHAHQHATGGPQDFARIPFSINTHAAMITIARMINNVEGGMFVSTTPLTNGLTAAPSQPSDWAEK